MNPMALALFHGSDTWCIFHGGLLEPPGRPAFGRSRLQYFHVHLGGDAPKPIFI